MKSVEDALIVVLEHVHERICFADPGDRIRRVSSRLHDAWGDPSGRTWPPYLRRREGISLEQDFEVLRKNGSRCIARLRTTALMGRAVLDVGGCTAKPRPRWESGP